MQTGLENVLYVTWLAGDGPGSMVETTCTAAAAAAVFLSPAAQMQLPASCEGVHVRACMQRKLMMAPAPSFVMQNIDTDQIIPAEYLTLVPSKVRNRSRT
jgi:hypothetical protein